MSTDDAKKHIGDAVIYRTAYGRTEQGVISSVNDQWVFVRYGSDGWGKATDPRALTLLADEPAA